MATIEEVLGNVEGTSIISCPVCREIYNVSNRIPLNVPCGHTICAQCSHAIVGPERIMMCPVCRTRHQCQFYDYSSRSAVFNFSKNYQLMDVVEKMTEARSKQPGPFQIQRFNCRECGEGHTAKNFTQCACVTEQAIGDLDFMGRPINLLICTQCIDENHSGHDVKPMDRVMIAWDAYIIKWDLDNIIEKIDDQCAAASSSMDNTKQELARLASKAKRTIKRLSARPNKMDNVLLLQKYFEKLSDINKSISNINTVAHSHATKIGDYADLLKAFGDRSASGRGNQDPMHIGAEMIEPIYRAIQQAQAEGQLVAHIRLQPQGQHPMIEIPEGPIEQPLIEPNLEPVAEPAPRRRRRLRQAEEENPLAAGPAGGRRPNPRANARAAARQARAEMMMMNFPPIGQDQVVPAQRRNRPIRMRRVPGNLDD